MSVLKSFIYGREDVLKGQRGYYAFLTTPDFTDKVVKQMVTIFSTYDPDAFILQRLSDFFVYFNLPGTEQWIFGKGMIEHRGSYYSYILHGVLLDEKEREALNHNPFMLADQLNPDIQDNRKYLPPVKLPHLKANRYQALLKQTINSIPKNDRWRLLMAMGMFIIGSLQTEAKIVFPYQSDLKAGFWLMLFALLPASIRRATGLCTFASFILEPVKSHLHIKGLLQPDEEKEMRAKMNYAIQPYQPAKLEKTTVGDFLIRALLHPESNPTKLATLEFYQDVLNGIDLQNSPKRVPLLQNLVNILETVKKQSLASLKKLKQWPRNKFLNKWHEKHFWAVWARYCQDGYKEIDFVIIMGPDALEYFDQENYHSLVNQLLDRISTPDYKYIKAFFEDAFRRNIEKLQNAILERSYLKLAYWEANNPKKSKNDLIALIAACFAMDRLAYERAFSIIVHNKSMQWAFKALVTRNRILLNENRRIYQEHYPDNLLAQFRLMLPEYGGSMGTI